MAKQIVTRDGRTFFFREFEMPDLGPLDVRVKVSFAAPKHGTEVHSLSGSVFDEKVWDAELRLLVPKAQVDRTPINETQEKEPASTDLEIGNMVVGQVIAVGAEVTRVHIGDEVFGYGPVRDTHQALEAQWHPLGGLKREDAVCVDPSHVALVAVRDGNIRIGDSVAVYGLGAIGLLAVQAARASGARKVFGVDFSSRRRAYAEAHGADKCFDPGTQDAALEIKLATGKKGVDVAIETSGNGRALHDAIRCIQQCGTIVHVPWGPKDATHLHLNEEFHLNRPTLVGSQALWGNADRSHPLWDPDRAYRTAIDLLREGLLTGQGLITPILSFEQAPEHLASLLHDPESAIKVGIAFN